MYVARGRQSPKLTNSQLQYTSTEEYRFIDVLTTCLFLSAITSDHYCIIGEIWYIIVQYNFHQVLVFLIPVGSFTNHVTITYDLPYVILN